MLKSKNPEEYKGENEIMDKAINLIKKCNEERYDELEASELFYTEQANNIKCVAEKSRKEGRKEGELYTLKKFAKSLYNATKDLNLVSIATNKPINELKVLLEL